MSKHFEIDWLSFYCVNCYHFDSDVEIDEHSPRCDIHFYGIFSLLFFWLMYGCNYE